MRVARLATSQGLLHLSCRLGPGKLAIFEQGIGGKIPQHNDADNIQTLLKGNTDFTSRLHVNNDIYFACVYAFKKSVCPHACSGWSPSSSSLLRSSLELSDTTIYEPQIRAHLGTFSHFCLVVVLKLRTVPLGTGLSQRILRVNRRGAQATYKRGPFAEDLAHVGAIGLALEPLAFEVHS